MIRVFVGTDGDFHGDAEKVLEYSIRTNTSEEVDLTFMRPGWKTPPTGFSSHRYLIPELCNYEGYAIYLDVDMLVLGDLSELMEYKKQGKWCITTIHPRKGAKDEVSVIDCGRFKDVLPDESVLRMRYGKSLARKAVLPFYDVCIPETWNAKAVSPEAKLIHYTNLRTQPWHPDPTIDYLPFPCQITCDLFFEYLEKANV